MNYVKPLICFPGTEGSSAKDFKTFVEEMIAATSVALGLPRHMLLTPYALQCRCEFPDCPMPGNRRRQLTAYNDDESNYATLCFGHQQEADDYWRERWDDYYAELL